MEKTQFLNNHFLIAMPSLGDPNFFQSVTFICEHNEKGAMGIIINQPMNMSLGDVLLQLDITAKSPTVAASAVFAGGPVQQDRGFVIHTSDSVWQSTLKVSNDLHITTSRDVLAAIGANKGPESSFVSLGYAGWSAGQLEREMADNSWFHAPADPDIIFNTPPELRWQAAAASIGIDFTFLSEEVGHA